jgi:D-3-phosphoglycerate dehydrogenase
MSFLIAIQGSWSEEFWAKVRNHTRDARPILALDQVSTGDSSTIECLVTTSTQVLGSEELKFLPALKTHVRAASGDENVDLTSLKQKGIEHVSLPEPYAPSTAMLTVSLLLSVLMRLNHWQTQLKEGTWDRPRGAFREFATVQVGVLGMGHVGIRVFRYLKHLGFDVKASDPFRESSLYRQTAPPAFSSVDVDALIEQSDVMVLCVKAATDRSRASFPVLTQVHLDRRSKPLILINTSRAEAVSESTLKKGLETGALGGCGLDVFWQEPLPKTHWLHGVSDRVVITPHIGSRSSESQRRMEQAVLDKIQTFVNQSGV